MRRNVDAIALFFIVILFLAVQAVSGRVGAMARTAALTADWCPRSRAHVVLPVMPRVLESE